ncbi:phage major tail tube protein, partial [Enterobacter hormaechei]|nr:phage major tail tube protein [Enterobacter hormaechei]
HVQAVLLIRLCAARRFDHGAYKQGDNTQTKISAKNTYFKLTWDGEVLIEVDTVNMVEVVNGEDRLADHRRAMGL